MTGYVFTIRKCDFHRFQRIGITFIQPGDDLIISVFILKTAQFLHDIDISAKTEGGIRIILFICAVIQFLHMCFQSVDIPYNADQFTIGIQT